MNNLLIIHPLEESAQLTENNPSVLQKMEYAILEKAKKKKRKEAEARPALDPDEVPQTCPEMPATGKLPIQQVGRADKTGSGHAGC